MDNSRNNDLATLHARFSDPTVDEKSRRIAYKSFCSIQSQQKDRKLIKLRHQLIGAKQAGDQKEADKIEEQIEEHNRKRSRHGI